MSIHRLSLEPCRRAGSVLAMSPEERGFGEIQVTLVKAVCAARSWRRPMEAITIDSLSPAVSAAPAQGALPSMGSQEGFKMNRAILAAVTPIATSARQALGQTPTRWRHRRFGWTCLCESFLGIVDLSPGAKQQTWAKCASPRGAAKKVSILFPNGELIDGIPITRRLSGKVPALIREGMADDCGSPQAHSLCCQSRRGGNSVE